MGNVVRLGDSVSCGDHVAVGSANVHAGGMPVTYQGKDTTTGHGCFPPTKLNGKFTSTVFVNNQPVALKGIAIIPHRCGKSVHGGTVTSAADTVSFEE